MRTIDPAALARIEAAVSQVERETAGEVVVVIARRSASFAGARAAFAFAVATVPVTNVMATVVMALSIPLLMLFAWLLASLAPVTRALVGSVALDDEVVRAAKVAFLDHGVADTRMRAGVLLYVSLFERRVQVLGDSGVHAVIGAAGWSAYADRIGGAMRTSSVDGLVEVVRDLGVMLARSFPPTDGVNELDDAVRVVDQSR